MYDIIKRDWILFRQKFLFLIPIISISLIFLYPKADEGYFVIGVPVAFIFSVFLFIQDDKSIHELLSMPFSRNGIARARFMSGWVFMGAGIVYIIVLGLCLGLVYPDAFSAFYTHLDLKTLFIYLWFLTILSVITFPVLFMFIGRGVQALLIFMLGLNVLLGVYFLLRFNAVGPDLFGSLKSIVLILHEYHSSPLNILISTIALLLINGSNLKLCERIFSRKEF